MEVAERVTPVEIETEMRDSYLDYAMSVIISRALPDVRDGLKPVQRRIIFAMGDMGLWHDDPHRKSARIVGEVLGKYHPHSDVAVYDAMVRMAQEFSLRYPLVDGQGNFGSVDGDGAAAMRYTEARLSAIAGEMLADLDKRTVDLVPNFDESLTEPEVLPARLPNLLVNGSSGIAVGMSTSIPPHNLAEVCRALAFMLERYDRADDIDVEELLQCIKGPDFPTGGILYAGESSNAPDSALVRAYATGRGRVTIRAKVTIEEGPRGAPSLVVSELPYQTNKARLVERIAELVRIGRLEGVADVRDESDRQGMRLVVEVARNADPRGLLRELFRLTPMESTFSIILLALVDGEPRTLSLKRMLVEYVEHRLVVTRRRTEYELAQAREREHVLAGLLLALDNIGEVIDTIRRSQRADTARRNLQRRFGMTERQAQAVLDMQLRRLASLERRRIEEEHEQCLAQIAELGDLLQDPGKMRALLREEVMALERAYGDERRTQVVRGAPDDATMTVSDLLPDKEVLVLIDGQSRVSYVPMGRRLRVPKGVVRAQRASVRQKLLLFTDRGRCRQVPVHKLPEGQPGDAADAMEALGLERGEVLIGAMAPGDSTSEGSLLLVTAGGKVKRIALEDLPVTWNQVIRLEKGDLLVAAVVVSDGDAVFLVSSAGQAIAFAVDEVRVAGLGAGGVAGMRLEEGQRVVAACRQEGTDLALLTELGNLKRVSLRRWRSQRRGGAGVVAMPVDESTGSVVAACTSDGDSLLVCGDASSAAVLQADEIPAQRRTSRGKRIVKLRKQEKAVTLQRL